MRVLLKSTFLAAALFCVCSAGAYAGRGPGGYPAKPVRVLVGSPAGSGSDVMARAVVQKLTERMEQTVIVDNRPGATGGIALQIAAQAIPDGYTVATLSAQNVTAMLLGTVTIDIPRALTPVVQMISQPYLMVATPSLPANSVKELIVLARKERLVYASSGTGSVVHLGMELFKSMAGVDMTHVPYKGSGISMIDVMSGRVQLAITNVLTATPLVRGGRLKALAITSRRRALAFPDVPTIAESGVPGYELGSWYGLLVPNRTPAPLIAHLNREVSETMNAPDVKEKLSADGAEAAPPNSPQQFRNLIDAEIVRWGKVIKTLGLKERGDGR